jgi:hypothetical protein
MATLTLMDHVRHLAIARADKALLDQRMKAARVAFDEEHKELIFMQRFALDQVTKAEGVVRQTAGEVYLNTGEKKPAPGVEVKVYKTMEIADNAAALAWAQQTKIGLVPETFDAKAILKVAAVSPLPFVYYIDDPRVTIATQLNAAELSEVPA